MYRECLVLLHARSFRVSGTGSRSILHAAWYARRSVLPRTGRRRSVKKAGSSVLTPKLWATIASAVRFESIRLKSPFCLRRRVATRLVSKIHCGPASVESQSLSFFTNCKASPRTLNLRLPDRLRQKGQRRRLKAREVASLLVLICRASRPTGLLTYLALTQPIEDVPVGVTESQR